MTLRHLIELSTWPADDIRAILERSADLKRPRREGIQEDALRRKALGMFFEKPSTRTRISFEVAAQHLGAQALYIDMQGKRIGQRESLCDVARVMSRYVDGILARVYEHETVTELARESSVPVVNGLSDYAHPMQALADFMTAHEVLGRLSDFTLVYIGDGNNVARSLAVLALKLGARMIVSAPPGYELALDMTDRFGPGEPTPGEVRHIGDPHEAVREADIVYTDVWASMGQEAESEKRRADFAAWQINAALMADAPAGAKFMHCLPAHRGEEVTDEVIDSDRSIVYDQAENRMHTAKAVLVELMGG